MIYNPAYGYQEEIDKNHIRLREIRNEYPNEWQKNEEYKELSARNADLMIFIKKINDRLKSGDKF